MFILSTSVIYLSEFRILGTTISANTINILSGPNSNLYVSSCFVHNNSAQYVFNIANSNGNIYVNNSIFRDFRYLFHLIGQAAVRIFYMKNVTFRNASVNMFFYNTLNDEVSHPHHNLTDCIITDIFVTGTYFSKLFPSTVTFENSIFRSKRTKLKIMRANLILNGKIYLVLFERLIKGKGNIS